MSGLPPGWTEGVAEDGRSYYTHAAVGTTWTKPVHLPESWQAALDPVSAPCASRSLSEAQSRGDKPRLPARHVALKFARSPLAARRSPLATDTRLRSPARRTRGSCTIRTLRVAK